METRDRAYRSAATAAIFATTAVAGVVLMRFLYLVLDGGWWIFVVVVAIGAGIGQWVSDRPRPTPDPGPTLDE